MLGENDLAQPAQFLGRRRFVAGARQAKMPMARPKKLPTSKGAPSSRSSGSKSPMSSGTSIVRPPSRTISRGRSPTLRPTLPSVRVRGRGDRGSSATVRSDGQNDQDGAPASVLAKTPPSAEDAFVVLPQNLSPAR